jgi:hypothetical protein
MLHKDCDDKLASHEDKIKVKDKSPFEIKVKTDKPKGWEMEVCYACTNGQ